MHMKKSSTSSQGSEKSRETPKRERKLVTFEYKQLGCFMSTASKTHKIAASNLPTLPDKPKANTNHVTQEKRERNTFSQLRVPRRNRGKIPSNIRQAFNNSILLLQYQNHEELPMEEIKKDQRQSPKSSEEDDDMVADVVKSCIKVITQETQHSSNPISSRYTSRNNTEAEAINYTVSQSYSSSNIAINNVPQAYYNNYVKTSVRNRRAISAEESNSFKIDVSSIQQDGRTSIMVRNIPNKYTQDMLLSQFEINHKKKFDFFYLPVDYSNNCNVGYAFINFIHTKFIKDFFNEFHNYKWQRFNSMKVCQVCYARIQGTAQLQRHFENSNVIQQRDRRFRPLIGQSLTESIHLLVSKQKAQEGDVQQG